MSEDIAIAQAYARAVFQEAVANDKREQWTRLWEGLCALSQEPAFLKWLAMPQLSDKSRDAVLTQLAGTWLDEAGVRLMRLVDKNRRWHLVPRMRDAFLAYCAAEAGLQSVVIESALPLSDTQIADLQAVFSRKWGVEVRATVRILPELWAGLRVRWGDKVWDASLQGRFLRLKQQLLPEG